MLKLIDIENNLISKHLVKKQRVDVDYLLASEYSLYELFAILTLRNDLKKIKVLVPEDNEILNVEYKRKTVKVLNYVIELK